MANPPTLGGTFQAELVLDPRKVAEVLRSPSGPVVRRLMQDGQLVKAAARRQVGVYRPPDAYAAAHRKRLPGTLRDSIVTRLIIHSGPLGVAVAVGSEDPIALLHHEGTRPHVIRARVKPQLVFYWARVGRVVAFRQVNHPGTQPNRYLTDSLAVLRRRY